MEKSMVNENFEKELKSLEGAYEDGLLATAEFENARAYLIKHPNEHIDLFGPTPEQEKSLT